MKSFSTFGCLTAWDYDSEFPNFMINYNMKSFVDRLMIEDAELLKSFELIFAQLKNSSEK